MPAYFFRSEPGAAELRRLPQVDAVTSARFKERIVAGAELERDGVVAFRAVDAQRILKEEFAIDCSLSSTYRLLHRIKLSWLAPRPRHPQADATAQAVFSQRPIKLAAQQDHTTLPGPAHQSPCRLLALAAMPC